jgi:acetyltransferase-like isoleucine patch superfamily enzyme
MIKILTAIIRNFLDRIHAARDPVGFARMLGVRVGSNVRFYGMSRGMFGSEPWMISIGNDCYITAGVQFINHDGGTLILRKEIPTLEWTAPIEIGNNVYIGINTIILPNVKIGNRCIIGAGSIVSRNIPDNSVYAGVPARFICSTDDYLEKMKEKSLGCGHLEGDEKASVIKDIYNKQGWFD